MGGDVMQFSIRKVPRFESGSTLLNRINWMRYSIQRKMNLLGTFRRLVECPAEASCNSSSGNSGGRPLPKMRCTSLSRKAFEVWVSSKGDFSRAHVIYRAFADSLFPRSRIIIAQ